MKTWFNEIWKDKNIKLFTTCFGFTFFIGILIYHFLLYIVVDNVIKFEEFFVLVTVILFLNFILAKLLELLLSKHKFEEKLETSIKKINIDKYVSEIIDSKEFISALRTTLPKGEKDKEYGLDHIPFLLQNSNDKRIRYFNISKIFLVSSIICEIIFSSVIIYFGYVLINDDAAGYYKALTSLENKVEESMGQILKIENLADLRINSIKSDIREYNSKQNIDQSFKNELSNIRDSLNANNIDVSINKLKLTKTKITPIKTTSEPQGNPPKKITQLNNIIDDLTIISIDYKTYSSKLKNSLESISISQQIFTRKKMIKQKVS